MKGLLVDCRHALRVHASSPGACFVAIFVLSIGIAFATAFTSLYVDLVKRPHPGLEQNERIVSAGLDDGKTLLGIPYGIVEKATDELTSIESAALIVPSSTFIGDANEGVRVEFVSRAFNSTLRPKLALGRGFRLGDHTRDAATVAVISFRYWQQELGGDPAVLGTTIEISRPSWAPYAHAPGQALMSLPPSNSIAVRIIGVMTEWVPRIPPKTVGNFANTSLWMPLESVMPTFIGAREVLPEVSGSTFVRLHSSVNLTSFVKEFETHFREELALRNVRLDAINGVVGDFAVQRESTNQLKLFQIGSMLLMLVSATNIGVFQLARAPGRRRELSIRRAVGAPMARIARQFITEASLLVITSAVLGLIVSTWLSKILRNLAFFQEAEWSDVTILDWRVLGFVCTVLLALTILVSIAPVLNFTRRSISESSRQIMARASLAQRFAGNVQIVVAAMLCGAAITSAWHFAIIIFGDAGYEYENRYEVESESLWINGYETAFVDIARQRQQIESIPGVTAVGFGVPVPAGQPARAVKIYDPAGSLNDIEVYAGVLERAYIDVLGLELAHGRALEEGEEGVVLANQTLAQKVWGRDDVVGERLTVNTNGYQEVSLEIVGVLRDISFEHPLAAIKPRIFRSLSNSPPPLAVIQTKLSAADLRNEIERIEFAADFRLASDGVRSIKSMRYEHTAADRARGLLIISIAVLVVLLAFIGSYSTQQYLVKAGCREYAIRLSLGAGPRSVGRLVILRGISLGMPGLVVGSLLAFITTSSLTENFLLRELSPGHITIGVFFCMAALLIAASIRPAEVARRISPAPLLREG